ncbi:MAG: hypothetical protein E6Z63_04215 [Fusobacterium periodonticum]|jgi:hypothetical protein|nr:hypothetical protein [Fusobacterium periodonticum]
MEEKKRKGYKTQEQQNEANKRYRATKEGKEKTKHSTYKSRARVFINEMATLEELEELENLIKSKLGGNKMNFNEFEKEIKIIEEKTGMIYKFNENTYIHTFVSNDEKIEFYDYLDEKEKKSDYRRIIKEMKEYFKIK